MAQRRPRRTSRSQENTGSSVPLSILLQPVRLNRNSPQWADPQTTRTAVMRSRAYWADCVALAKITVSEFRLHLDNDLRSLPLAPTVRDALCQQLKPLMDAPVFWRAVEEADQIIRDAEHNPATLGAVLEVWGGQFFRTCFARQPHARAHAWARCGRDVVGALDLLRMTSMQMNQRSTLLRLAWESGNVMALLAAIQEKLPVQWVEDAEASVKRQKDEGATPGIRRRAGALLKKIKAARSAVGKGNITNLAPEHKRDSQRRANARDKAITRLVAYYDRLREEDGCSHPQALQLTVEHFTAHTRIGDSRQRTLILQGFRKRIRARQENLP